MPKDRNKTPAAKARFARYRANRRKRIGIEADRARGNAAQKKSAALHRNQLNEKRRQVTARNAARSKKIAPRQNDEEQIARYRVVTGKEIRMDTTRWEGPGMRREIELEQLANEILSLAERRKRREAAQCTNSHQKPKANSNPPSTSSGA